MDSFKSNFSRRPNLFDDPQISSDQVQKYRTAKPLNIPSVNPIQLIIEKLRENPFQSSFSSIPTPLRLLQGLKCGDKYPSIIPITQSIASLPPIPEVNRENTEEINCEKIVDISVIKEENEKIVDFSLTAFMPKDSTGHKAALDFSLAEPLASNMLNTLCKKAPVIDMEASMGECPINSELLNIWGNKVNPKSAEKQQMEPISLHNIELTTSFMVPYNRPDGELSEEGNERSGFETSQQTSKGTILTELEEEEEEEEQSESEDSEDTDSRAAEEQEEMEEEEEEPVTESQYESKNHTVTDSWKSSVVVEISQKTKKSKKIEKTEKIERIDKIDKGICTEDLITLDESIPAIRILVDKVIDTIDLVPEKIEEEKVVKEDKVTDTNCLVISKDQLTDTNELVDEEKRKTQAQINSVKLSFLTQLNGLKGQLETLTEEQAKTKQSVQSSITGTIDNLSDMVRSSMKHYIQENKTKQMHGLLAQKQELNKAKNELSQLRCFVLHTTEKIKEAMATYILEEGKNQIQKLIEDSAKDRLFQFGLNKLNEYINDNHSISTESSHVATPLRIDTPTKETPGKIVPEKKTRSRKPKKMDKAVLEGMRYLLGHEGFDKDHKDKLENLLKPQASNELTSEIVLNSLMDRGVRRRSARISASMGNKSTQNNKEDSVGGKRMRLEGSSMIGDDESVVSRDLTAFEVESVASEKQLEFSTPVKFGGRKKVKTEYRHPDFMESQVDNKVVLMARDVNSDNKQE